MAAAEGLGGPGDVGDAVHGGGRGARGGGHEDGQVWHLGQVNDACREKQEDCQEDAELLQLGCAGEMLGGSTHPMALAQSRRCQHTHGPRVSEEGTLPWANAACPAAGNNREEKTLRLICAE